MKFFFNKKGFVEIEKSINGEEYNKYVLTIKDPNPTDRMNAQMAEFTLSTELLIEHNELADKIVYEGVYNGEDQSVFEKYIIPGRLKKEFMNELNKLDINGETLFPGLDGVGRRINESIAIRIVK